MRQTPVASKIIFLLLVGAALTIIGACAHKKEGQRFFALPAINESAIVAAGLTESDIDLDREPGRLYVWGNGKVQRGAQAILKIKGLQPHTRIYWCFEYRKGPYNENPFLYPKPFSPCAGHPFRAADNSTLADETGETRIRFTSSTYAGDTYRFGASLEYREGSQQRVRDAAIKSGTFTVFKRLYLEQPKILEGVRFPASTWEAVSASLAALHIEVQIAPGAAALNRSHPSLGRYFKGEKGDARYGPQGIWGLETLLKAISLQSGDSDPATINVVILGALSEKHDLIRDADTTGKAPPQPVDYEYSYKTSEMAPREFSGCGTAMALIGDCPAVFVWADYWWLLSQRLHIGHERTMARVILHELGHHLLTKAKAGKSLQTLDDSGHLVKTITSARSIMNGCRLTLVEKRGRADFSPESIKAERRFINNPTWHPQVERLIRRYYIPLKQ